MHAQVVCVPPVLLLLYVNIRSWSQPFLYFPSPTTLPACQQGLRTSVFNHDIS